jgi:hypothetical protein
MAKCRPCQSTWIRPDAFLSARAGADPTTERLNPLFLLVGEKALIDRAQPLVGNLGHDFFEQLFGASKVFGENPIEAIEEALILDQRQPRQPVKFFRGAERHARRERFVQRQQLGERHRHTGCT